MATIVAPKGCGGNEVFAADSAGLGYRFTVLMMDGRRIARLRLEHLGDEDEALPG